MSQSSFDRLVKLVELSVLIALICIFAFTGIGYIKVGTIEITLIVIPVAIGAIALGPAAGAICGTVFGITSFIQCFGLSAFGAALLSISPLRTLILCVVPRILCGYLAALVFKLIKNNNVGYVVASVLCPLFNTILFMSTLILLFSSSDYIQNLIADSHAKNILGFIVLFVGINGAVEIAVSFVISSAVCKALASANKNFIKRGKSHAD